MEKEMVWAAIVINCPKEDPWTCDAVSEIEGEAFEDVGMLLKRLAILAKAYDWQKIDEKNYEREIHAAMIRIETEMVGEVWEYHIKMKCQISIVIRKMRVVR